MTRRIVMIGTGMDTRGGVASVVRVYADEGLLERRGVRYIATHGDGSKWTKLGRALRAWLLYMGLLWSGQVALLHVHSASGPSFWRKSLFIVPSFWLRVPVVLHMHGGGFARFYAGRGLPGRRAFIRWLFGRCAAVVALSDQWKATLAELFPRARLRVIANPMVVPPRAAALVEPPAAVLFLGALVREKGVFDLLEAWTQVRIALPEARLQLGGVGDEAGVRAAIAAHGLADAVQLLGWIDPEARQQALQRAWALVLPSHMEALPMAVLEAMAAGVPVVATCVGGIPLAVRSGVDGLLVEPAQPQALAAALVEVLGDAERRRAMGAQARQRVQETFAASVILPQVESLWAELLGARPLGLAGPAQGRGAQP